MLVHGKRQGYNFKNLTIMGVTKGKVSNPNARAATSRVKAPSLT